MLMSEMKLPSAHQIDDVVLLSIKFANLECTISGVRFTEGKVRYDLWIDLDDNNHTIIENVDSCFVTQ